MQDDLFTPADKALLAREFTTTAPEAVTGLVESLPPSLTPPEILFAYDVTPPKGVKRARVRCAHCHRRIHWKGWVLGLGHGVRALIGKDCGTEQYGFDFRLIERRFKDEESRKLDLLWLVRVREHSERLCSAINDHAASGAMKAYLDYRAAFGKDFGLLSKHLARTLRDHSGRLVTERRVRDVSREEERAHRQRPDLFATSATQAQQRANVRELRAWMSQQEPIWNTEIIDDGPCVGYEMLIAQRHPDDYFAAALQQARDLAKLATSRASTEWTASRFKAGREQLASVFKELDAGIDLLKTALAFTLPDNLRRVSTGVSVPRMTRPLSKWRLPPSQMPAEGRCRSLPSLHFLTPQYWTDCVAICLSLRPRERDPAPQEKKTARGGR